MLEELHLISLKRNVQVVDKLCSYLKRNYLKKLSLVKAGLGESSIQILAQVVKSSKNLVCFDMSWNSMAPKQMLPMI